MNMPNPSRPPPKKVEPLIHENVKFLAPWDKMGYIEARDKNTNDLLWDLKVYEVEIDPNIEHDVQEIYIASIKLKSGALEVRTEFNTKYMVNLETKEVRLIK